MALTRKLLKGMGLTEEQVDTIIEAHTDTTDALKEEAKRYKGDAEKLPDVQKELDELKAAGDGGYKQKYEDEKKAFEDFKAEQTAKELAKVKANAYIEQVLKPAGVSEKRIAAIMKVTDMSAVEMDGDKVKNAETHTESVKTEWADFIETANTNGANTNNPPANNQTDVDPSAMSMEEYIKYRQTH